MSPYNKKPKYRSKLKEYIQTINKTSKNIKEGTEGKQNEKQLTEYIKAFTKVYENHIWGTNNDPDYEGSSGVGSDIRYNSKTYVPFLRNFIKKYKINSVDDLGCGDFRIGLLIYNDLNIKYIGYDAYNKVIEHNTDRFKD